MEEISPTEQNEWDPKHGNIFLIMFVVNKLGDRDIRIFLPVFRGLGGTCHLWPPDGSI